MELPNYFLADLPAEAVLTSSMLTDACQTLRRNREQYLMPRTTTDMVRVLSRVADNWLDDDYPFRKLALAAGPSETGFSQVTLERGLDGFFRQITRDNLRALLAQDLGDERRLDQFAAGTGQRNAAIATGPELIFHIAAGRIPNPTMTSILLGLLTRSAQFVKCASGGSWLPRLFAHSLYEADHKLGACLEVAEWKGGSTVLEAVLFDQADCVTATGNDDSIAAIQSKLPRTTRFVGYGLRVSFGYLAADGFAEFSAKRLVQAAADDVTAWNQLGCLSPHVFYVQPGGEVSPEQFAQMLAEELERRETSEPRGELPATVAASIASRRHIYEVRAAQSSSTALWQSSGSTAWTVVYEADPLFALSCLHRFVYVKAASNLTEALQGADQIRGRVSTVGVASSTQQVERLAGELARWGASRVCPIGQMQNPPLTWRHDGRPALGELVTWTDLEV